jgi:lipopolysaccharide transport system permease protein
MTIAILKPWQWVHRVPFAVAAETRELAVRAWRARRTLVAVTAVELRKRHAGSILGILWFPLYSALLLAMYCFIYVVVFRARFHTMGSYDYTLFIFAGLIPYLGFSEAVSAGVTSIKSNIAIMRNTIFPAELIPIKQMLAAVASLMISLGILILLLAPTHFFGWHLIYLPVPLVLLCLFCASVLWVLSAIAVLVPDIAYFVNIMLLFFMWVSPIGFTIDQVPPFARALVYANPMSYLIDSFRYALLGMRSLPPASDLLALSVIALSACVAGAFFRRLMPLFTDYE